MCVCHRRHPSLNRWQCWDVMRDTCLMAPFLFTKAQCESKYFPGYRLLFCSHRRTRGWSCQPCLMEPFSSFLRMTLVICFWRRYRMKTTVQHLRAAAFSSGAERGREAREELCLLCLRPAGASNVVADWCSHPDIYWSSDKLIFGLISLMLFICFFSVTASVVWK